MHSALTLQKHNKRIQSSSAFNDKACMERTIIQAKCIEYFLCAEASTLEEYINRSTFPRRFVTVIHNYQSNKNRKGDMDETMIDLSERFDSLL